MEDLAQQVVEAENVKVPNHYFCSEAFVFVVRSDLWAPFTQNHTTCILNTVCSVYPVFKHWMSKGIVPVTVSSVRYVYICYR